MKNKVLFVLSCLYFSVSASAAPITVSYEGTVTDLGILLAGDGVAVGDTVFGEFSYDTDIAGTLFSFDITIGTFSSSLTGSSYFSVQNDQQNGSATLPADGFTLGGEVTTTGLNGNITAGQQFGVRRDNVLGQLWNDTLLPDLTDWANITLADINAPDWHWMDFGLPNTQSFRDDQIRWDVTSFSVRPGSTSVPEASALSLLLLSCLSFILAYRRR